MSDQLLEDVRQFLLVLEAVQQEQAALLRRKRVELKQARAAELQRIAEAEAELVRRTQALLLRRKRILQQAVEAGLPGDSLLSLSRALAGDDRADLEGRIVRARELAGEVRTENVLHWIVAQRAYHHYSELLELIAHRGKKAPTYGGPGHSPAGGAMLDASV